MGQGGNKHQKKVGRFASSPWTVCPATSRGRCTATLSEGTGTLIPASASTIGDGRSWLLQRITGLFSQVPLSLTTRRVDGSVGKYDYTGTVITKHYKPLAAETAKMLGTSTSDQLQPCDSSEMAHLRLRVPAARLCEIITCSASLKASNSTACPPAAGQNKSQQQAGAHRKWDRQNLRVREGTGRPFHPLVIREAAREPLQADWTSQRTRYG